MIVQMKKYTFLIFHKEYVDFLEQLQQVGLLHTLQRRHQMDPEEEANVQAFIGKLGETLKFLKTRKLPNTPPPHVKENGKEIVEDINNKRRELSELQKELEQLSEKLETIAPWGEYSITRINQLRDAGVYIYLYKGKHAALKDLRESSLVIEKISETSQEVYFALVSQQAEAPQLPQVLLVQLPKEPRSILSTRHHHLQHHIKLIDKQLDEYSAYIDLLTYTRDEVIDKLEFDRTLLNTEHAVGDEVMILEGFTPIDKTQELEAFLEEQSIVYITDNPASTDQVPVLLENRGIAKFFEPITRLFSLPTYGEMDLTPFFAPFFMLFFGFCLGDAGYGLLILLAAIGLTFHVKDPDHRRILSLGMWLGIGTMVMGAISGTFFGVALAEAESFSTYREYFLTYDQLLNLSMILGLVQIIFGLLLRAYHNIRSKGTVHGFSEIGWIILIYGLLDKYLLQYTTAYDSYLIGGAAAMILLFSQPDTPWLKRLGVGIWSFYNITGIFGDVLSYIRLFALGVSSSILGMVVNKIAWEFSTTPVLGPIILVVILLIGHGINFLISALGAFVHPLRLTFVEFYKNAGFQGGGVAYKPFSTRQHRH